MRQSLSGSKKAAPATRTVWLAAALTAVLAGATLVDQFGARSLIEYSNAMYEPHGKQAAPGLLYGLVYAVAVLEAAMWLPVIRVVRSRSRLAPILATLVTIATAGLAVVLLVSAEYGEQVFPPLWGTLAILPPAVGVIAVVQLFRRPSGPVQ
ncbi:MAG TPA: hypothetical protein VFX61_13085 [Micromonosporaceae bacterium]|nr:hypothetical protein [Micromonosporaceae bacterium]